MRHLLSAPSRAALRRLCQGHILLAFDFDGTLAPLVDHPSNARVAATTKQLLRDLALLYPVVVISGRSRGELLEKLHDCGITNAIGNHGAEAHRPMAAHHFVEALRHPLERKLEAIPGCWLEYKGLSLTVHYRSALHHAETRLLILDVLRSLKETLPGMAGLKIQEGKQVVNLIPTEASHKGHALAAERQRLSCDSVLYVGDDENDEDAFAAGVTTIAVRVGRKLGSHAAYYLRDQQEIDQLLRLLIRWRGGSKAHSVAL